MTKPAYKYIDLPIFSIATYKTKIFFSGGGGHGISNQILIYEEKPMQQINKIETQKDIIENIVVNERYKLLAGSAIQDIIVYTILQQGKDIAVLFRFRSDYSLKNPTLNTVRWKYNSLIIAAGGDDCIARVYDINLNQKTQNRLYECLQHGQALKHVELHKSQRLLISVDIYSLIVSNYQNRQTLKRVSIHSLQPSGCQFQSAQFKYTNFSFYKDNQLVIVSYVYQGYSYLTKYNPSYDEYHTVLALRNQTCLTAVNEDNLIALASGNGIVQIYNMDDFSKYGKSHNHDMVIKGIEFIQNKRVVSGSPQCSYHIQDSGRETSMTLIYLTILILVIAAALINSTGQL